MAQLIDTNVRPADAAGGFTLQELYTLLGCETVEAIALRDGRWLLMDEDAKGRTPRPAPNADATGLLHRAGGLPWDVVLGQVIVCTRKEFQ